MKKNIILSLFSLICLCSCAPHSFAQDNAFYNNIKSEFNSIIKYGEDTAITDSNKLDCSLMRAYGLNIYNEDLNNEEKEYMNSYTSNIRMNLSESEKNFYNNKFKTSSIESISKLVFSNDNSTDYIDEETALAALTDYSCSLKQEATIFGIQDKNKGDYLRSCNKNSLIKPRPTYIYNCETEKLTVDTKTISNFIEVLCGGLDNSFTVDLKTRQNYYFYPASYPGFGYNNAYEITFKNGLIETLFFCSPTEGANSVYSVYRFYTPTVFSESRIIVDSSIFDNIL